MDSEPEELQPVDVSDSPSDSVGDLQMETQMQVQEAVNRLNENSNLSQDAWDQMDAGGRLETMQGVEATMAEIQGRDPVPVEAAELEPTTFGGYDGSRIVINQGHLNGNEIPVDEFVDTIVHEGRHAYQDAAVQNPELAGNAPEVQAWAENMQNYLPAEIYGQEIYQSQPIEADAWAYGAQIRQGLYGSGG